MYDGICVISFNLGFEYIRRSRLYTRKIDSNEISLCDNMTSILRANVSTLYPNKIENNRSSRAIRLCRKVRNVKCEISKYIARFILDDRIIEMRTMSFCKIILIEISLPERYRQNLYSIYFTVITRIAAAKLIIEELFAQVNFKFKRGNTRARDQLSARRAQPRGVIVSFAFGVYIIKENVD